jgi:hypothetical protein
MSSRLLIRLAKSSRSGTDLQSSKCTKTTQGLSEAVEAGALQSLKKKSDPAKIICQAPAIFAAINRRYMVGALSIPNLHFGSLVVRRLIWAFNRFCDLHGFLRLHASVLPVFLGVYNWVRIAQRGEYYLLFYTFT